jgi:Rrf2 family protein
MMLDLAQHYDEGPIRISDIAKRQDISVKYLEQLIIPLKTRNLIKSARGPKGGHMLGRSPEKITVGEIVKVLEGGIDLVDCIENPEECDRYNGCLTRGVWEEATKAMYDTLNATTLSNMIENGDCR